MVDTTTHTDKKTEVAKSRVAAPPQALPKTTKGQKHVAPPGRHSQQTHRIAEARAAALGHTTEKEQHAHDRNLVVAEQDKRAALQLKQQSGPGKKSASPIVSVPEKKQEG